MKIIFIGILIIATVSCSKQNLDKICNVDDPLTELPWLSDIVSNSKGSSQKIKISKVILKDKTTKVFRKRKEGFTVIIGTYEAVTTFYNCSGEIICSAGGITGETCNKYDILKEEVLYEK